jgi:hypothetical protein
VTVTALETPNWALMCAVPEEMAVTLPVLSTVATAALSLLHAGINGMILLNWS